MQKEAVAIYNLCHKAGIHFSAEWIPRYSNVKADYWSKIVNTDDWIFCRDPTSWTVLLVIIFSSCPGFVLDGDVLGPNLLTLLMSAGEGITSDWFPQCSLFSGLSTT